MRTKSIIKRIGSLFFLGIFLWFYSVKDIHDVIHGDDIHCHVKDAHHFHPAEHYCPICDFAFPYFDDETPHIQIPVDRTSFKVQNFYTVQAILSEPVSLFSSRGPPAVA
jgi:hypothetical protein